MTYIVKDECIKCKLTDCVEVCPVDCFYEGENMLVINPDECIDCGVCEPECPIDAIVSDDDPTLQDKEKWLSLNDKYSRVWPNISKKKDPMPEHKKYEKMKKLLISSIIFSTIVVTVVTVDRSSVETTPCELSGAEHAAIKIDIKIIKQLFFIS